MKTKIAGACAGALAVAACGGQGPLDVTGSTSEPIINGMQDTGDPAVVLFDDGNTYCSGTLVSPHVVLTAGHCTNSMSQSSSTISFGSTRSSAQAISVSALFTDPMYPSSAPNGPDQTNGHDQGVVILSAAGPAAPVALNRTTLTTAMAGQTDRIVGWGRPTVNGTGGDTKLWGTDTWDMFTDYMIHFGAGPQHECSGDSGGPAIQMINGCPAIIGIVSFHDDNACMSGWYNRVDNEVSFVDQYIQMYDPGFADPCASEGGTSSSSGGSSGSGSTSGSSSGSSGGSSGSSGGGSSGGVSSSGSGSGSGGSGSGSSTSGSSSGGTPASSSGNVDGGGTPGGPAAFDSGKSAGCGCIAAGSEDKHSAGGSLAWLGAAVGGMFVARRRRRAGGLPN